MNKKDLKKHLQELGRVYDHLKGPQLEIGICGGAALILTDLIPRATKDIDLLYPLTLPLQFLEAVKVVAQNFGLPENWINQGPKDLFTMGLPADFRKRAVRMALGGKIVALLADRKDQIFFKLYAAADRGGYHVDDLKNLNPAEEELIEAVRWVVTHDPSEGFWEILISMLEQLGYESIVRKIQP